MKKLYEKPLTTAVESLTDEELLLSASGGYTTDDAFSRRRRVNDWDDEDDWDVITRDYLIYCD